MKPCHSPSCSAEVQIVSCCTSLHSLYVVLCLPCSVVRDKNMLLGTGGPKVEEMTGDRRKLHNESLHDFDSSPHLTFYIPCVMIVTDRKHTLRQNDSNVSKRRLPQNTQHLLCCCTYSYTAVCCKPYCDELTAVLLYTADGKKVKRNDCLMLLCPA